jgi:quercetin dioxygenase-like cupin family protein
MRERNKVSLVVLVLLGLSPAATPAAEVAQIVQPEKMKWVDNPQVPGSKIALVLGDPKKPGPYVLRLRIPPYTKTPPHSHPDSRQVTVLSGSWNLGEGERFDPTLATRLTTGAFVLEAAKVVHYNFTAEDEAVVQISGTGPTTTYYIKP